MTRFIAGTIVVAAFYFIADGFIHGNLLGDDHRAAITGAGKLVEEKPANFLYFAAFDLGKAFVVMLLVVALRALYGPGITTTLGAGLVAWLAIEVLPNLTNMPFPFYPKSFYWKWIALELVPVVLGALIAARILGDGNPIQASAQRHVHDSFAGPSF